MQASGPAQSGVAEGFLSQALGRLFAVAEAYPQLRASENFQQLQGELTNTEDQISAARRIYNGNVQSYNTRIQTFPNSIIASIGGFTPREFFEIEDGRRARAGEGRLLGTAAGGAAGHRSGTGRPRRAVGPGRPGCRRPSRPAPASLRPAPASHAAAARARRPQPGPRGRRASDRPGLGGRSAWRDRRRRPRPSPARHRRRPDRRPSEMRRVGRRGRGRSTWPSTPISPKGRFGGGDLTTTDDDAMSPYLEQLLPEVFAFFRVVRRFAGRARRRAR